MKAVVYETYGPPDVLHLVDVPRPVPKDDEVLVKVHATTVNRTDAGLRSAEVFISRFFTGLLRPRSKILGMEFAGKVEAIGNSGSVTTSSAATDPARMPSTSASGRAHRWRTSHRP